MEASELRGLRLKLGLTQHQMGERLGITRGAVTKLEAGKNPMSKPVEKLALILASQSRNLE